MLRKIVFQEHPGTADLGSGDLSCLRAATQFLRVTAQIRRCFLKPHRWHRLAPFMPRVFCNECVDGYLDVRPVHDAYDAHSG